MSGILAQGSVLSQAKHALDNNLSFKGSDVIKDKTHVSPSAGQRLNALAEQNSHDEIVKGLTEQMDVEAYLQNDAPIVRSPDRPMTSKAQVLLMIAKFQNMSANMTEADLNNALSTLTSQAEARIAKAQEIANELDELHADFDKAKGDYLAASDEYDSLVSSKNTAEEKYGQAKEKFDELQTKLDEAQAKVEHALEDFYRYGGKGGTLEKLQEAQKELGIVKKDHSEAQKELKTAGANLNVLTLEVKFAENKMLHLQNVMQKINVVINTKTEAMNKLYAQAPSSQALSDQANQHTERALASGAFMMLMMMQMMAKIDEASQEKLQTDLQINRTQAKARQAEMKRKSDEYEEQVRKAKEAEEMAGCIGKILGGLAIAFGAITSVFGGGGVALMAVGIALMAADPIVEAITGESLTGMIMNPIMEHLLMPLMKIIGDVVADIFDKTPLGWLLNAISEATGIDFMDTVHTLVTAAVAIAIVVAVAMVAKSVVKVMIEKMSAAMTTAIVETIKKSIMQVINKIVPQILKNGAKQASAMMNKLAQEISQQVTKQVGKVTKQISNQMDKLSQKVNNSVLNVLKPSDPKSLQNMGDIALNRMGQLRTGLMMTNTGVQAGYNIAIADLYADASEAIADFKLAQADFDILSEMISTYLASYQSTQETISDISRLLSDDLKRKNDTGVFVVNNIKA